MSILIAAVLLFSIGATRTFAGNPAGKPAVAPEVESVTGRQRLACDADCAVQSPVPDELIGHAWINEVLCCVYERPDGTTYAVPCPGH